MKNAQISLFVIIGIVLLIIVSFIIIRINTNRLSAIILPEQNNDKLQLVINYMDDCLKKTSVAGMQKLGDQGILYPEVYMAAKNVKVAYFYFRGKGYFPSEELIEDQLAQYIEENVGSCINSFSRTDFVIDTSGSMIKASANFSDSEVITNLSFPIRVYNGGEESNISEFSARVKVNFNNIYRIANNIYTDTMSNPEWVSIPKNQTLNIQIITVDTETLVYEITDSKYGLEGKPYRYRFGVKYEV